MTRDGDVIAGWSSRSWHRSPRLALGLALRVIAVVAALGAGRVQAAPRLAVLIGNNGGERDEVELRFAEDDAAKLSRVLRDLGGFRPDDIILLRGENADTARQAVIRVNERLRAEGGGDSLLVVFYSGHADTAALHLGGTHLPMEEMEGLVRGSPARTRILIVDACRSGSLTRVKGGTPAPPFALRVERAGTSEGAVFLTSSAANEDAQESDALRGSFFTHYLVSGLLGAADGDGDRRVTLSEAYAYAYEGTIRASSRTLAGTQHPTFSYELRGHEDVTLTTLSGTDGRPQGFLTLPPARNFLVFQGSADGSVIAETSAETVARRLTLPPGRYFVRGRGRDDLVEGMVVLNTDAGTVVSEASLTRFDYARLVRKGAGVRERAHGVQAGLVARTGLWSGSDSCQGAFAGYEVVTRGLSLSVRGLACRSGFANDTLTASADDLTIEIEGAHVWDLPVVSPHLGLAAGPSWLRERFATTGTAPSRQALAATVAMVAGVEAAIRRGLSVDASFVLGVHALRERETAIDTTRWTTPVTFGGRAGVVWRW